MTDRVQLTNAERAKVYAAINPAGQIATLEREHAAMLQALDEAIEHRRQQHLLYYAEQKVNFRKIERMFVWLIIRASLTAGAVVGLLDLWTGW